jgi:4a-hydroxytetrahydrobiopterin dehydratase
MNAPLAERRCKPCEGGIEALTPAAAQAAMADLHPSWRLNATATQLERDYTFPNFLRTMSFVNALAHIANVEDHHPDLQVGYNYCRIVYTTHAIQGLSENDFICAAKVDRL